MIGRKLRKFRQGFRSRDLRLIAERRSVDGDATNECGMPRGDQHRDDAAEAFAKEVGLLDPQVLQKCGDIVGILLEREGAIDIDRASVPLQVAGDELPVPN